MRLFDQIEREITKYLYETVDLGDGIEYSEYKLKKRIEFFKNRYYPTGKVTEDGDYEYWFDLIDSRIGSEKKNLRIDSKYFLVFSKNPIGDFPAVFIANARLAEWMEETGRAEELSESVEAFSGDGNLLMRKTSNGYEMCDMPNTFLTNTTARTVNGTAIIERVVMEQSDLRRKEHLFDNVDNVIRDCGNMFFARTEVSKADQSTDTPQYELYRRTGEVSEKDLFELQGKKGGDEKKYVLARIVVAGLKKGKKDKRYVLFAEEIDGKMSDWFKEAHRGAYKGRWWREGLYELLMDVQVAYNDVCNEINRAIPWNTKVFLRHTDARTIQNVRNALKNGDMIKSKDIQQIVINARITEALNYRNTLLQEADAIANSYEVVRGSTPASGVPLGTTQQMNDNANKLFDFLRKKLAVPYRYVYREFLLPQLVKDLKGEDIMRLTGSPQFVERFKRIAAESWFWRNAALIGPHTAEMREEILTLKMRELEDKDLMVKNTKAIWKEILPRLYITIVGENFNTSEQEVVFMMLQVETDPVRRAYLADYIYASRGIPVPPAVVPGTPQVSAGGSREIPPDERPQSESPLEEEPIPAEA